MQPAQQGLGHDRVPDPLGAMMSELMVGSEMLTGLELVHRAAVGTLGLAGVRHIEVDLGWVFQSFMPASLRGQYTPPCWFRSLASN